MPTKSLVSTVDTSVLEASSRPVVAAPVVERERHMNWVLKALLPIAVVLINGLLMFVLVSSSLDGSPFLLYGNGEQSRDFTYVADVVAAMRQAAWPTTSTSSGSAFIVWMSS